MFTPVMMFAKPVMFTALMAFIEFTVFTKLMMVTVVGISVIIVVIGIIVLITELLRFNDDGSSLGGVLGKRKIQFLLLAPEKVSM